MKARLLIFATAVLGVGIQAQTAGRALPAHLSMAPVEELRIAYLTCDRMAMQQQLNADTGTRCALVSEVLLQRGFAGSVDQLLKWRASARSSGFAAKQPVAFKVLALAGRDRDARAPAPDQPAVAFKR